MADIIAMENEYYELLDEFIDACREHVSRGQPYMAVLLCHELFRFLYPVEPFARFEQADPVGFSTEHIRKLVHTARAVRDSVAPYPWRVGPEHEQGMNPLEIATSDLYSALWTGFTDEELVTESVALLSARIPAEAIARHVVGKRVLDMGCGSGRYSIALFMLGAASVDAIDVQAKAYGAAKTWCEDHEASVTFHEGNVHQLPFEDRAFDFVFCNGVLHHTSSVTNGIRELSRVMRDDGAAFLYLYAAGGIFWNTRIAMRRVFREIPVAYTRQVLNMIGMPSKRFIFCDTWYVPVETLTSAQDLHKMLEESGFSYQKLFGRNSFDLDRPELKSLPGAESMWGDGEHRYLLRQTPISEVSKC